VCLDNGCAHGVRSTRDSTNEEGDYAPCTLSPNIARRLGDLITTPTGCELSVLADRRVSIIIDWMSGLSLS